MQIIEHIYLTALYDSTKTEILLLVNQLNEFYSKSYARYWNSNLKELKLLKKELKLNNIKNAQLLQQ